MVAEKNNFSSNAWHNLAKGKVISKCKNHKPCKKQIGKVPAPPSLRRPAPAPYFHPFFENFQIPPSGRGNQNLLPSL